jgi:Rrf2 family protein
MRISRKAEYALRALTAMARKPAASTSQIEELAAAERIPVKFLEQILLTLKRAGLLRSRRGVGGGYQLERPPEGISVGEIVTAIDGPFEPMPCAGEAVGGCGVGRVFRDLQTAVNQQLGKTSLADVVAREPAGGEMVFEI